MMLVGLDEVVDTILDMDSKPTLKKALEELTPYNPRVCSQCGVDFSLCWKKDEGNGKGFVLCERCASQNVKKDLKAEHTSRLKSVFLKALKQEQEIEEKIKNGEDINVSNIAGGGNEKSSDNSRDSPVVNSQPSGRISSPKSPITVPSQSRNHSSNTSSDSHHHHGRPVVQHYPHHSPLVQQLHHQHMQQEPPPSQQHRNHHSTSRSHPYRGAPSTHHREHHRDSHHRTSGTSEPAPPPQHQEYYVVHHPQHAGGVRYINR